MLDDSPVYQDSSRQMFASGMSVASSARTNRSVTEAMAKDKIYRWITFRMKFNKDYLTDMFRAQGDPPSPNDLGSHSMMRSYLRDPNTMRLGTMLKEKYSAEGFGRLSGNSYFLFGLPRVKRINEEFYRTVEPDAEEESIAESASQEPRPNMGPNMDSADMPTAHDQDQDESNIYAKSIKRPTIGESRRDPSFRSSVMEQNDLSASVAPKVHDRIQGNQKREAIYGDYIRQDLGATSTENAVPKVHDRAQRSQKRDAVYGDYIRSDFGASKQEPTYIGQSRNFSATKQEPPYLGQSRNFGATKQEPAYLGQSRNYGATKQEEPPYLGQSRNFGATKQEPPYLGQSRKEKTDMQWREIEKSTRNDPYKEQFFFKGIN